MPPPADTASARLFVAVEPPTEIVAALAAAHDAFTAAGAPRLRWARPEGVHLTLKFLGETPLARCGAIEAALLEAAATAPHLLRLSGYGLFGGRRPRVLWVGLAGEVEETAACAARLERALSARGFPPEARPFSPHLTLARLPARAGGPQHDALRAALAAVAAPPPLPLPVTALSLIRSRLEPAGARYETLTRQELRPPSA